MTAQNDAQIEKGSHGASKPRARKRFGQHFLEVNWITKLISRIQPQERDLFLEIGSGKGQLTLPISTTGAQIIAIEIDRQLAIQLQQSTPSQVRVITGNVLQQDIFKLVQPLYEEEASPFRVVGNLPYNLSTPILRQLFDAQQQHLCFSDATLMLQQEVADRVVAETGSPAYGPLAIMTQLVADAKIVLTLPPGAFRPPPKVRSALIHLTFRPSPIPIPDWNLFLSLVRKLFIHRRKTMLNSLRSFSQTLSPIPPLQLLRQATINPESRPGTLELTDFVRLATALYGSNKSQREI